MKRLRLIQLPRVSKYNLIYILSSEIIIKSKNGITKFKLRCPRYLYTIIVDNLERADKIRSAIPSSIQKIELNNKGTKKTEKATGKKAPKS